jgi:DNA helicase-2/ATP-dependent DNA helicase PcrA
LRAWRIGVAQERSVPAYVVCTDVTLTAIAERLPSTREELLDIPGIGPAKLELYGEALLAMAAGGEAPMPGKGEPDGDPDRDAARAAGPDSGAVLGPGAGSETGAVVVDLRS